MHTPTDRVLLASLAHNAIANGNGASQDCLGYRNALIMVIGTTAAASTIDAKVQDSADNAAFADVTNAAIAQIIASQTNKLASINLDLAKRRRYLRVPITIAGTVSVTVLCLLFNPIYQPPTQTVTPVTV